MSLRKPIKIALDETRLLITGAGILLGFQLNGPFLDAFDALGATPRMLTSVAFLLMVISVGALIAPSAWHRLAERGAESPALLRVISGLVFTALLPFALSLGIDVHVVATRFVGDARAVAAGTTFFLLAVACWYGPGWWLGRRGRKEHHMPEHPHMPPLETQIDQMLTEARVVLPGAQALLGFQLSIVLTRAFEALPSSSRAVHAIALACICLAVILLMTPAAYHRLAHGGEDTADTLRVGGALITTASVPLGLGIAADVYVVLAKIADSPAAGAAGALFAALALLGLWIALPIVARRRRGAR